ncbi:MAG TPA: hypothetical protein VK826_08025 [Bacteroidia bacterium]|nr:hypothetical protein [Bacteroidia bacterium]
MKLSIVTEAPGWFLLICILAGLIYSAVLYFRDKRYEGISKGILYLLSFLRFTTVTILAFLLLSPLLKTVFREVEKPVIVIATDHSESIIAGRDSAYYQDKFIPELDAVAEALSEKFTVVRYSFGDHFAEGEDSLFDHKETDFTTLFAELETRYSNRNLGAVVVASDGIFNRGGSPVYSATWLKAPVFAIALGDTVVKKDILVQDVHHNSIAFLGNKFPVEMVVRANKAKGETATLTLKKGGQVLNTQKVAPDQDVFTTTFPVELEATSIGIQKYTVEVSTLKDEENTVNNTFDFFVEVLDSRQRVLIIGAGPHPDIGALKLSIEGNDNYQVTTGILGQFNEPVNKYNLAILHSIPSETAQGQKLLSDLSAAGIPAWYITGIQSRYTVFNSLKTGLTINTSGSRANDCQPVPAKDFPLFSISETTTDYISRLPAVQVPFATFESTNSVTPFMKQKIGSLATDFPLWIFSTQESRKVSVFAGEGLWKWRMADFADHGNHEIFDELIGKTIQYLSLQEERSFFRVSGPTSKPENEQITFDAEVYNQSYELIQTPDVFMEITDEAGTKYKHTFSKTSRAYHLDAGRFSPGEYAWEAKVKIGNDSYTKNGRFVVTRLMAERAVTTANHRVLFNLAQIHNGQVVYPATMKSLVEILTAREDIRPVIYNPQKLLELVEMWWIFAIICGLLTLEWFIRKRQGAY